MRPERMEKVSIAAHKDQLQRTIDALYRLKLLDMDQYGGELERGDPFEEAEELSEMLIRTRSLLSRMPDIDADREKSFQLSGWQERLEEISDTVDEHEEEVQELEARQAELSSQLEFARGLRGSGIEVQDLEGSENLDVRVVKNASGLKEEISTSRAEVFRGKKYTAVVYYRKDSEKVEEAVRSSEASEVNVPDIEAEGSISEAVNKLEKEKKRVAEDLEELENEFAEKAESLVPELESAESFLSEKVEKAEAPLNFATTERSFIVEGWIPEDKFEELGEELHRVSGGKIHLQSEQTDEEPPVKYDNNKLVQPFESLTQLVSTPKYNEIDPSALIFLMFPALFGFMIGDAGYGITSGLVFAAGYKYLEGAREIFKSLLWASFFTFLFGLAFGDAFGYIIFGHHSELTAVTGIALFEQIPILWHRAEHLGEVFNIAAAFGFLHVNLGILLGFYNEYVQHGLKEAFLAKMSWIVLEIGAIGWYALGATFGVPILLIGLAMLTVGEGVEGIVEIPSLVANILSYLRIFGVAVAAVSLAKVVNGMADPLFGMGGATGLALGTLVLVAGHTFNTGIKIMEGFLQGIRLHYVEFFTKFYEGGGRRYVPFGTRT